MALNVRGTNRIFVQQAGGTRDRPFTTLRPACSKRAFVSASAQMDNTFWTAVSQKLAGLAAVGLVLAPGSFAAEKVGEFAASGILFKDSVETLAIDDPEVKGVTVYISDFKRNLKDKLSSMGEEPSSASVTCAVTGPIQIQDPRKIRGSNGEDVFSEKRGLGFIQNKTLHVRRIFDETHKTLLYVAYSTRLTNDKAESPGRYKTSICALPISAEVAPVQKTSDNDEIGLFSPVKNSS